MQSLNREDILRFLQEVDHVIEAKSSESLSVIVIGGGGIALKYDPRHGTMDIDTFGPVDRIFMDACREVNASRSRPVPVDSVGVADGPWGFESRLQVVEADFKKIRVYVPEAHDLILMKVVRGEERDIEGIIAIGKVAPVDPVRLVALYTQEMSHCIGDNRRLRLNFLDAYAALFGVAAAQKIEGTIHAHGDK